MESIAARRVSLSEKGYQQSLILSMVALKTCFLSLLRFHVIFCYHRVSAVQCVFLFAVLHLLYVCFFLLYASGMRYCNLRIPQCSFFGFVLVGRLGLGRIAWIG